MGATSMSSPITTHVLDQQRGKPATGMVVTLQRKQGDQYVDIAQRATNQDGRVTDFLTTDELMPGLYQLIFQTAGYFYSLEQPDFFFPSVTVEFKVSEDRAHYHVPLLLSPFGYSTYRGS